MKKKKARRPAKPSLGKVVQIAIGRSPASDASSIYALTDHGEIYVYGIDAEEDMGVWIQLSSLVEESILTEDDTENPDEDAEDDTDENE